MTARSTAHVLVWVMLLSSGRLLACGLECLGEVAVAAEPSCHQQPAQATAITGDAVHACLPEIAEPAVRLAKPVVFAWAAMPLVSVLAMPYPTQPPSVPAVRWLHHQLATPHQPGVSVLRI